MVSKFLLFSAVGSVAIASKSCSNKGAHNAHSVNGTSPCAVLRDTVAPLLSASGKRATVPAKLAYDCLKSVPLHATKAHDLVEAIIPFIEWQSDKSYLKNPPDGYKEHAIDIDARLADISKKAAAKEYKGEYDFQMDLYHAFTACHDEHFQFIPDLIGKVAFFRTPVSLASVSVDGVSAPEVYITEDALALAAFGTNETIASSISRINGKDVYKYLETLSQVAGAQDPDALYNDLFFNPSSLNSKGGFGGSGDSFALEYQGDKTTIEFANGTAITYHNEAIVVGDLSEITNGESVYQKFCTGPEPTTTASVPNPTYTPKFVPPPGYPQPVVLSGDQTVAGYYLTGSDIAVLSILSFEPKKFAEFQAVVELFLKTAKVDGKTKLLIDLSANGGGSILQGYDTFRQLFPSIEQDGYSRLRSTEGLRLMAEAVSGILPATISPDSPANIQAVWTSVFNYRFDLNITNQPFESVHDKYAPHVYNGDNYTALWRWNLNDPLLSASHGSNFTGYGNRANFKQPFDAADIVMLYDGVCASTCTVFSEFMRVQGGVKSVTMGGRHYEGDSAPIIQNYGGIKGAQVLKFEEILADAKILLAALPKAEAKSDKYDVIRLWANDLPLNRSLAARINIRDNILRDNINDGVPAQFIYEPTDCRLFYTPPMLANVTNLWTAAADAAWGTKKCNAGSLPGAISAPDRRLRSRQVKRDVQIVSLPDAPLTHGKVPQGGILNVVGL